MADWVLWDNATKIEEGGREHILFLSATLWNDCLCPSVEFLKIDTLSDHFVNGIFFGLIELVRGL